MNAMNMTSSFSNREKRRRDPWSRQNSRSISLRRSLIYEATITPMACVNCVWVALQKQIINPKPVPGRIAFIGTRILFLNNRNISSCRVLRQSPSLVEILKRLLMRSSRIMSSFHAFSLPGLGLQCRPQLREMAVAFDLPQTGLDEAQRTGHSDPPCR